MKIRDVYKNNDLGQAAQDKGIANYWIGELHKLILSLENQWRASIWSHRGYNTCSLSCAMRWDENGFVCEMSTRCSIVDGDKVKVAAPQMKRGWYSGPDKHVIGVISNVWRRRGNMTRIQSQTVNRVWPLIYMQLGAYSTPSVPWLHTSWLAASYRHFCVFYLKCSVYKVDCTCNFDFYEKNKPNE